jgi:hypothetical protein
MARQVYHVTNRPAEKSLRAVWICDKIYLLYSFITLLCEWPKQLIKVGRQTANLRENKPLSVSPDSWKKVWGNPADTFSFRLEDTG